MARPLKTKSLEGATSTGAGSDLELGGRITLAMFVVTDSDPTTLDVEVEVSFDETNYTSYSDPGNNQELALVASEFDDPDGNGNFAAFTTAHGVAAEYARARITDYGSAGNVDVWLAATNNKAQYNYRTV